MASFDNKGTTTYRGIAMVIAKRTKWHHMCGIFIAAMFVYPCLFGVSYAESPTGYWMAMGFLFAFILPVSLYCLFMLRNQQDAIVLDGDQIRFATMTAWGRCSLEIGDITECSSESIPELHDHLVLSVTDKCYEMHRRSKTWVETSPGKFRFDMMYTAPSLQECEKRMRQIMFGRNRY